MSEEEAIKLLKYKILAFNNDVYLGEALDKQNIEAIKILLNYIEQLQQENEELKETLKGTTHCFDEEEHQRLIKENKKIKEMYTNLEEKYIENVPCCNEHDCLLYKDYFRTKIVLTEFEKWLEEEIKRYKELINPKQGIKPYGEELHLLENSLNRYKDVLNILQELKKEGKK